MFKLVIQDDEGKTTVVPLIRDEITIGRKEGNTIRLTERNVSRRHARILRNNGEVQIEDLGSYNGIRVNNARIAERVSLRVSDQVQIGDYKLYLKAEGVEQVDDARTMPIERIETATEVMGAVAAPTSPMPVPPTPSPMGGASVRASVGVADTDPAGRPVATAAQVAALTSPVGYGKLVVFSSNFAGKEFELSRPQMIVGRTDENDIVINHRSISRNHAKITRDPETGRYTISDLQSSNGVRVNGQDYGKVELRRGDQIDLGHVRLRYVEPGEDFVFGRDVQITDVAEGGSKRGLMIAALLAVAVIATIGAFFAMKGGKSNEVVTPGPGSDEHGPTPAVMIDAAPQVVTPVVEIDAGPGSTNNQVNQLETECQGYFNDKKWQDMQNCATKVSELDLGRGKKIAAVAKSEQTAELTLGKLEDAAKDKELAKAKKLLDQIGESSVYRQPAESKYKALESEISEPYVRTARDAFNKHDCKKVRDAYNQALQQGSAVAEAVKPFLSCKPEQPPPPVEIDCSKSMVNQTKKCKDQFCAANPGGTGCPTQAGSGSTVTSGCKGDPDELMDQGRQDVAIGQHGAALSKFEDAYKCKPETQTLKLMFMEACESANKGKAKLYFKKLDQANAARLEQICIKNNITDEMLKAP